MPITKISVRGARQHNLKIYHVEIPRNSLTVITGLSGSGKSSLAFDTIYAEGQRRYVETLSAYARQFLDQMERPDVDAIDGLSPSISIEQKTTSRSPALHGRNHHRDLRLSAPALLLHRASRTAPIAAGRSLASRRSRSSTALSMATSPSHAKRPASGAGESSGCIMLLAPAGARAQRRVQERAGEAGPARLHARAHRRRAGSLEDDIRLDKRKNHTIEVVVDRLLVKPGIERRLEQFRRRRHEAGGRDWCRWRWWAAEEQLYSSRMACPTCGINVPALEPRSFSFNSVYGACPECHGLGSRSTTSIPPR